MTSGIKSFLDSELEQHVELVAVDFCLTEKLRETLNQMKY